MAVAVAAADMACIADSGQIVILVASQSSAAPWLHEAGLHNRKDLQKDLLQEGNAGVLCSEIT